MTRELWTVAQTAEALGCSERTVNRLVESGQLPCVNVSVRLTRIDPDDVAAYIESRRRKVAALQQAQKRPRRRNKEPQRGGINNSGYYPGMKVVQP